jgi:hypothetical protein
MSCNELSRRRFVQTVAGGLLTGLQVPPSQALAAMPKGLYVEHGTLMRARHPYRGIGANYFDLFYRLLRNPNDSSSLTNLRRLAQHGIPFVRFMCGGYWPSEQSLYLKKPAEFFARLDWVVDAAERCGMGLIPSLFWNVSTVPDLMGEPMQAYGDPKSRTNAYIRRFTQQVVTRYRSSEAIWGWEFGNEYNLVADLPNASEYRPPVAPNLGTPTSRSARDELHWNDIQVALHTFATTVRRYDPQRILLTGNAVPRPSAYHNLHDHTWQLDTVSQFETILQRDNPSPIDTLCVHLYPDPKNIYPGGAKSLQEVVGLLKEVAKKTGKPLVIEEFGVSRQEGTLAQQRAQFQVFLDAFSRYNVPLAAFWVFDFAAQDADWNVTFDNDRAFMLQMVSELNRTWATSLPPS